jgi:hypothetical protein
MNPVSTQSKAVANRSAMPASSVTMSGNLSIMRPQRSSAVSNEHAALGEDRDVADLRFRGYLLTVPDSSSPRGIMP